MRNPKYHAIYREKASNFSYLQWKHDFLSQYIQCRFSVVQTSLRTTGKQYEQWFLKTRTHPVLSEWRNLWYPNGKKLVPLSLVERYFSPLSFCVWFCDDGTQTSENAVYLFTFAFQEPDVHFLRHLLTLKLGLDSSVASRTERNGSLYYFLKLKSSEWSKVEKHVSSFSPPGMEYKWTKRPHNIDTQQNRRLRTQG